MDSKLTALTGILIFLTIFLSWILFSQLNQREVLAETEVAQEVLEEKSSLFSPIQASSYDRDRYLPLDICHKGDCVNINETTIKGFYNGSQLRKKEVRMYVLEYVVPYFERLSGGKVKVENSKGSFYTWKNDTILDTTHIYTNIENILLARIDKEYVQSLEIEEVDIPGTDGTYSDKYIEIDHSKQRLYVWLDGKLERTIRISGAYEDFETHGVFPIVDKGINPMAPTGHYMPYWMAFYRADAQDSWYGLHALVWWYDDYGSKVFESTDNIGKRKSAGCLRMLVDEAKYLYEIFDKGDHILIHK